MFGFLLSLLTYYIYYASLNKLPYLLSPLPTNPITSKRLSSHSLSALWISKLFGTVLNTVKHSHAKARITLQRNF